MTIPEPFAAPPSQLLQLADKFAVPAQTGVKVLFDDSSYTFDAEGRATYRWRRVFQILQADQVDDWSTLSSDWSPWHQARPELQARVITRDGREHVLDPKTITQGPAREHGSNIFSDAMTLRAPLPAVAVGAVVEQLVVTKDTAPLFSAGIAYRLNLSIGVPLARTRMVISAAAPQRLRVKAPMAPPQAVRETQEAGRTVVTIDYGPVELGNKTYPLLPPEVPRWSTVEFSVGESWQQVAAAYSRQVDAQLAKADPKALLSDLPAKGTREQVISQALAKLHREVRYTGMELGEASLIPHAPSEVLKRHYGDCKDKATLLVGMLRAKGIAAYVALLNTGPARDIDPELPGMGRFDHAIVHVPGTPSYWIDATDEYAALGTLASADRGRWILVASADTTELKKTAELQPGEGLSTEFREIRLAKRGPASVVEVTEPGPQRAAELRGHYAGTDQKQLQKDLDGYMKRTYLTDKPVTYEVTPPNDLTQPFKLRLSVAAASRGYTDATSAVAAIPLGPIAQDLPEYLRAPLADEGEDKLPPRTADVYFSEPFVNEWRYRIIPPEGFRVRDLPRASKANYGSASLSQEYAEQPDGVVLATFRFDSGPGRVSPARAEEMRRGLVELNNAPATMVNFDHVGELLLSKGKVKEAVAYFQAEIAKSPKDPMPRMRLSQALLRSGLGEAAREEARLAVEAEPKSVDAWRNLGWIREHDSVGRLRHLGYDRAGALAAYRHAKALPQEEWTPIGDLAILLEHNVAGDRYAPDADLEGAIAEYRAIGSEKLAKVSLENNLHYALFYAGRLEDLRKAVAERKDSTARMFAVALAAVEGGAPAAAKEAGSIQDANERRQAMLTAGNVLMRDRRYPLAAEVLTAGAQGAPNAARNIGLANALRNTKRLDQMDMPAAKPNSAVLRLFALNFGAREPVEDEFWSLFASFARPKPTQDKDEVAPETAAVRNARRQVRAQAATSGLPLPVLGDVGLAMAQLSTEGDDQAGYRVRVRIPSPNGQPVVETYLVIRENDGYVLVGSNHGLADAGTEVLRRAAAGDLLNARKLLDWIRELIERTNGEDPYAGLAFPYLWERGEAGDLERVRTAVASLRLRDAESLTVLQAARAKVETAAEGAPLDHALGQAGLAQRLPEVLLLAGQRLAKLSPNSATAFTWQMMGLSQLRREAEADALVADRLRRLPNDAVAMRLAAGEAMRRGQWKALSEWTDRLEKAGLADAQDYNNLAWAQLVEKGGSEQSLELVNRGLNQAKSSFPILHTAAALYAEMGRLAEAREYLLQGMEAAQLDEPNAACAFVQGQIAEQLGLKAVARQFYERASPASERADPAGTSTAALAKKRLARLR